MSSLYGKYTSENLWKNLFKMDCTEGQMEDQLGLGRHRYRSKLRSPEPADRYRALANGMHILMLDFVMANLADWIEI